MAKVDDGGQAFPAGLAATTNANGEPILYDSGERCAGGMTLRDYFAAKAMQGLVFQLSGVEVFHCDKTGLTPVYDEGDPAAGNKRVADWAYLIADAMLAARKDAQ